MDFWLVKTTVTSLIHQIGLKNQLDINVQGYKKVGNLTSCKTLKKDYN